MENTLKLKIITPNKIEFDDYISLVSFNTIDGIIVLQKNYAPTIGSVCVGKIHITTKDKKIVKIIGKGAYIISDNNLEIITGFLFDDNDHNIHLVEMQKINAAKQLTEKTNHLVDLSQSLNITKIIQQLKGK